MQLRHNWKIIMDGVNDDTLFTTDDNGRVFRKYEHIKTKPIPRVDCNSKEINKYLKSQV